MNWLDGLLIAVIAAIAYLGLRTGLISAAFTVIGVWVGIALAGRFSDDLGEHLTSTISNDTLVTVIAYAFIFLAVVLAARIAGAFVRKAVGLFTMGLADPLGGAALGVVAGVILAGALVTGMARLAYDFEVPQVAEEERPGGGEGGSEGEASQEDGRAAYAALGEGAGAIFIERTRGYLEGPLVGSAFAAIFVEVVDGLRLPTRLTIYPWDEARGIVRRRTVVS